MYKRQRGCAKSTLVRAFQEILSQDDGYEAPFVEVPLGASEERLLGSVDAVSLVEQGQWKEHSGLLEQAHGGVLYVDEVNLLPDHLVDQTLDAAASGRYRLEREGLSREVEARFILVGTMNPEEGDLRPQLLDRFTVGFSSGMNTQQKNGVKLFVPGWSLRTILRISVASIGMKWSISGKESKRHEPD